MKFLNNFQIIESLLWENENIFLENFHILRMENSAKYFSFNFSKKVLQNKLSNISKKFFEINQNNDIKNSYKIRIFLSKNGELDIKNEIIKNFSDPKNIIISEQKVNSKNEFLYHKTTYKPLYEQEYKKAKEKNFFGVIFLNEKNEITEANSSNIFIQKNNKLFTPPIKCGLLAGTFRDFLLQQKKCTEKILTINDLKTADKILLGNSVRRFQEVVVKN